MPSYLVVKPEFRFAEISEKFQQLMHALSDGSGDYHLYFLVIILKCYLCYPLIRLLQFSPRRLGIIIGFLLVLTWLNWTNSLFGWFSAIAPYLSSFYMLFWLPYFLIGIWIAKEPEWINQLVQKLSITQWGIVWAIAASLEVGEFYFSATILGLAEPAGHSYRPTVVLLTLTALTWAMSWQPFLKHWQKLIPEKHLNIASAASFTTYLIHPDVLRLVTPLQSLGGIAYLVISAIASWAVGILVWKLLKPIKGLNAIIGA